MAKNELEKLIAMFGDGCGFGVTQTHEVMQKYGYRSC